MKTYIKVFLFLTILVYLICSIYSSSWDPMCWYNEIKKILFYIIWAELCISLIITIIINEISD
jgi:hypothetical protein